MAVAKTRTESASARVTMNTTDANRRVRESEAAFEQGVRGDEVALEIPRQERERDDDAAEDVAGRDLEKREVAEVGEAGDADEGEGARLRGDDRDEDGPPGDGVVGDEVVAGVALRRGRARCPAPSCPPGRRRRPRGRAGRMTGSRAGYRAAGWPDAKRPAIGNRIAGLNRRSGSLGRVERGYAENELPQPQPPV